MGPVIVYEAAIVEIMNKTQKNNWGKSIRNCKTSNNHFSLIAYWKREMWQSSNGSSKQQENRNKL